MTIETTMGNESEGPSIVGLQCKTEAEESASPQDVSPSMISNATYGDADGFSSDAPTGDMSQGTPPLHPLHSSTMSMNNSAQQHQVQQQMSSGGLNGGSEVELARRLGVRFDSSNAAWVARWVESHSEKKKSRWFSVAKYGEISARRLAIQACLQNMKPSDYPSLRDLQDVLASFAANPPTPGGPAGPYLSGNDMGAGGPPLGNMVRGMEHYANKMASLQYMQPHQIMHQHPFASIHGVPNPAISNYMAAVAAAGGMPVGAGALPTQATQLNGSFCQGVPQHQAALGYCLDSNDEDVSQNPTMGSDVEGTTIKVPKLDPNTNEPQCSSLIGMLPTGEPTEAPVTAYMIPPQVSSHDSSSDLETRSAASEDDDDDDDDDDLDSQDKGSDYEGRKRKRRKVEETAIAPAGIGIFNGQNGQVHPSYYSLYPPYQHPFVHQMNPGQNNGTGVHPMSFLPPGYPISLLHPHLHPHAAAAAGFLPHLSGHPLDMTGSGLYMPQGAHYGQQALPGGTVGGSPTSGTSPGVDCGAGFGAAGTGGGGYKRLTSGNGHHNGPGSSASSAASGVGGPGSMAAKMTCERGLHYSKCYQGSEECWIAVWNTKGGRIMHEAFDVTQLGFEEAKAKAREARDAAHSNNVTMSENSRPSWKSHSNTGIPHVSLDSQQLRFRAHKFGRRLCRSFSFGRRRGSFASRENAFDAAVLWLIQTPTEEEIAAVSGRGDGV